MSIQTLSEDVVFVNLPAKAPERGCELAKIIEIIEARNNCDVIISLAGVEIINSLNIGSLLILHNLLNKQGRHLILCYVGFPNKCIFSVVGLKKHFNFTDDKFDALEYLRSVN